MARSGTSFSQSHQRTFPHLLVLIMISIGQRKDGNGTRSPTHRRIRMAITGSNIPFIRVVLTISLGPEVSISMSSFSVGLGVTGCARRLEGGYGVGRQILEQMERRRQVHRGLRMARICGQPRAAHPTCHLYSGLTPRRICFSSIRRKQRVSRSEF